MDAVNAERRTKVFQPYYRVREPHDNASNEGHATKNVTAIGQSQGPSRDADKAGIDRRFGCVSCALLHLYEPKGVCTLDIFVLLMLHVLLMK
jgi:hypothetical protein